MPSTWSVIESLYYQEDGESAFVEVELSGMVTFTEGKNPAYRVHFITNTHHPLASKLFAKKSFIGYGFGAMFLVS